MEAASSAMEVQSLNCWTTREIPLTLLGRTAHEWLPIASGNSEDCWPKVDHVNPSQSLRPWGWGPEQVVVATSGLQHTRLLCPSPSPRACSNSSPLSRWCQYSIIWVYHILFIHWLINWWTFGLLPHFGSYGWCCYKHSCMGFSVDMCFYFPWIHT